MAWAIGAPQAQTVDGASACNCKVAPSTSPPRRGFSHAAVERLSVLTRLPPPHCLSPTAALRLLETNFPESRFRSATDLRRLSREFAEAGLAGGALYDGLVGAAARKRQLRLVTCDRRAEPAYRVLGVSYELLSPISR
jgi:hypothetical protein